MLFWLTKAFKIPDVTIKRYPNVTKREKHDAAVDCGADQVLRPVEGKHQDKARARSHSVRFLDSDRDNAQVRSLNPVLFSQRLFVFQESVNH